MFRVRLPLLTRRVGGVTVPRVQRVQTNCESSLVRVLISQTLMQQHAVRADAGSDGVGHVCDVPVSGT